jgi:hypothetical protein
MAALAKNRSFTAKSPARQARTLKPFTVPEGLVTLAHAQWMLLALGPGSSRLSGVIFLQLLFMSVVGGRCPWSSKAPIAGAWT